MCWNSTGFAAAGTDSQVIDILLLISTCLQSIVDEILADSATKSSSKSDAVTSITATTTKEQASSKITNGLAIRSETDLERLNNNEIFDRGNDDDDL